MFFVLVEAIVVLSRTTFLPDPQSDGIFSFFLLLHVLFLFTDAYFVSMVLLREMFGISKCQKFY